MSGAKYQVTEERRNRQTTVSDEQMSTGITNNVREAILRADEDAYGDFFEKINAAENNELILHHSTGAENAARGRVITFNVAGSGFSQPMRFEKGIFGKSDILAEGGEKYHIGKGESGKTYTFTEQDGSKVILDGSRIKEFTRQRIEREYGTSDPTYKHIRKKQSPDGRKVKYSIAGPTPGKLNGKLDAGDYSIKSTRENIYNIGKQHLAALRADKEFMNSDEPILFSFSGHSRGAVAAIHGALRLKQLIKQKYPELANRVRFESVLYDPVPGPEPGLRSSAKHSINLKEQTKEMKELGMETLGENDHTTVLYSMGCDHASIFSPMKILGADTVILTPHPHHAGQKHVEQQYGITRRKAYINAENMEAYRASGLCEMPKGVYLSDENNIMVPVKNMDVIENVLDQVYTAGNKNENRRIRRINEACTDVKLRQGDSATLECIMRGFNAHDPFYVRSSKEFRNMKAGFTELIDMMSSKKRDDAAINRKRDELKKYALDYLKLKSDKGPHSNRTQGRISVAKNIVSFLDGSRAANMQRLGNMKVDNTPKTNDLRMAYIENAQSSLKQNTNCLSGLCDSYQSGKSVENGMFMNTLASMLVDRRFLTQQDKFMPQPLTDTMAHPETLKSLDQLLGTGEKSLFQAYKNSPVVRASAQDILKTAGAAKIFSDPGKAMQKLDAINQAVMKQEAARVNVQNQPVRAVVEQRLKV